MNKQLAITDTGRDPAGGYWSRRDGRIYSAAARDYVPADDPCYRAWLARGNAPTHFPRDAARQESEAALLEILDSRQPLTTADAPEETRRRLSYEREADPLFRQAAYYAAEAEGHRLNNHLIKAAAAKEKAQSYYQAYAAKKDEIRARHAAEA